jgi:hypothetical protein
MGQQAVKAVQQALEAVQQAVEQTLEAVEQEGWDEMHALVSPGTPYKHRARHSLQRGSMAQVPLQQSPLLVQRLPDDQQQRLSVPQRPTQQSALLLQGSPAVTQQTPLMQLARSQHSSLDVQLARVAVQVPVAHPPPLQTKPEQQSLAREQGPRTLQPTSVQCIVESQRTLEL